MSGVLVLMADEVDGLVGCGTGRLRQTVFKGYGECPGARPRTPPSLGCPNGDDCGRRAPSKPSNERSDRVQTGN